MSVSEQKAPPAARAVVMRWIEAFNGRDLEGMLACLDPEVDFQPLKLIGREGRYTGREGAAEWFDGLTTCGFEHVIQVPQLREASDGHVVAIGSVVVPGQGEIARFCGLHEVGGGLILAAQHYFSDPDMLEHLGRIPSEAYSGTR